MPMLTAAEREGKQLWEDYAPKRINLFSVLSQEECALLMAVFSLAVRQSTPFAAGDGPGSAFASIRQGLCKHFLHYANHGMTLDPNVCEFLAPALLRTDALQCYSRILAEAAEQLAPAAGLAASGQQASGTPAELGAAPSRARPGSQQGLPEQEQHLTGAGVEQQQRSSAWRPGLQDLDALLFEVLRVLGTFAGFLFDKESAAAAGTIMQDYRAQLQSSHVLEHWVRLLLLGSTATLLEEGKGQQRTIQNYQTERLHDLSYQLSASEVSLKVLVERPWGCTLAATHMAQLCAALDGGHAFGLPELDVLCLPACTSAEAVSLSHYDDDAFEDDKRLAGQSASLRLSVMLLQSWLDVLRDELGEEPGAHAVQQDRGSGGGGHEEQQEPETEQQGGGPNPTALGGSEAAPESADGGGAAKPDTPGASFRSLPPFNRPATAALCLRLAKGVLASWGGTLPRVRLQLRDGAAGRDAAQLPKLGGSAVLQYALSCARLALMPDVWGRTRVQERTRAQLREWWETYVAAAQHPEALLVAEIPKPPYPDWTKEFLGEPPQVGAACSLACRSVSLPLHSTHVGGTVGRTKVDRRNARQPDRKGSPVNSQTENKVLVHRLARCCLCLARSPLPCPSP